MAKRQREWAKRARLRLIEALGAQCVRCGATDCLTLEHIDGCDWDRKRFDYSWRMSIYRWEAKRGRLTVLCISCNRDPKRRYRHKPAFPYGYRDG